MSQSRGFAWLDIRSSNRSFYSHAVSACRRLRRNVRSSLRFLSGGCPYLKFDPRRRTEVTRRRPRHPARFFAAPGALRETSSCWSCGIHEFRGRKAVASSWLVNPKLFHVLGRWDARASARAQTRPRSYTGQLHPRQCLKHRRATAISALLWPPSDCTQRYHKNHLLSKKP